MSGQGKEAEKGISLTAEQAGSKMDSAVYQSFPFFSEPDR